MATLNYVQLMQTWVNNGGSKATAPMAAAIAMAESSGITTNQSAPNVGGSVDRGLWQINSSSHPEVTNPFDPNVNAAAAVKISSNGTNWHQWCTAYSDAACGSKGGKYLGAGSPFYHYLQKGAAVPGPAGSGSLTITGSGGNGTGNAAAIASATSSSVDQTCVLPINWPSVGPLGGGTTCLWHCGWSRAAVGALLVGAGGIVTLLALALLVTGKAVVPGAPQVVNQAARHYLPARTERSSTITHEKKGGFTTTVIHSKGQQSAVQE